MGCCLQPGCKIDEKGCVSDELFLAKFRKEHFVGHLISRRKEFDMEQAVRVGIDHCVQPEPLVIELDHGFVNCDVIRIGTIEGLYICFPHPVVNGGLTALDA